MTIVFDRATSAEFWRRIYSAERAPVNPCSIPLQSEPLFQKELQEVQPAWLTPEFLSYPDGIVHLLAFESSCRRRSKKHAVHVWHGPVPDGSFYRLKKGVYVESPEFMFLSAASSLSLVQLIAFGDELCGLYGFDKSQKRGFRKRKVPLTTKESLQDYLHRAQGCRGYRKAKMALPHIIERAASPMETFDEMALCLPYRLGGYGIPQPLMNYEVTLSAKASRIAKRGKCYADMCYPKISLDIEHHGKLDHSSDEDWASDRARVNGLKEMGYEVIELTKGQVDDLLAFEYIIMRIAKMLGKRIAKEKLGATPERAAFRCDVFAWNASSGRLR